MYAAGRNGAASSGIGQNYRETSKSGWILDGQPVMAACATVDHSRQATAHTHDEAVLRAGCTTEIFESYKADAVDPALVGTRDLPEGLLVWTNQQVTWSRSTDHVVDVAHAAGPRHRDGAAAGEIHRDTSDLAGIVERVEATATIERAGDQPARLDHECVVVGIAQQAFHTAEGDRGE